MLRSEGEESHSAENIIVRLARKVFHTTDYYDGDRLFTVSDGKRAMTPMLLVMVAIGGTDILFALDSIPAIFGLTQNTFIVFTATAFSLLGLRQLFFLIDGLLDRLIYLSFGLAAILAFIGVKLILHALHENNVPFINDGNAVPVVEISTGLSLSVILGVLGITVLASLLNPAGRAQNAITNARHHATSYLDTEYTADPAERERIFRALLDERDQIIALGPKYRQKVRDEPALMALLERALASNDAAVARGEAAATVSPKIVRRR
jgi:tellurite resistance protein TerC